MENYRKARTVEQPCICPFTDLPTDTPKVHVKDGSKLRNLLRFALSHMGAKKPIVAEEERGLPTADESGMAAERQEVPGPAISQQIVFTASGKGVSKAITCAEIMKRRLKKLHQLTRLLYCTVVEEWEPLEPAAGLSGLDSLTVSRNLPAIWILLSCEPLDCSQPGYQAPGCYDALWAQNARREEAGGFSGQKQGQRRKKGGGVRGKGAPGHQKGRL
ncbi:ribonuclease P protein subunit p25-like protein [Thalassophryne amazonica]|uniref:ribonuclease P protein subunit p25-like protein n=1 Tax=Thalassophryne amazonica TaxID=390379 RepID=UPI0014715409|nr:ribonuclease P protein subunit p25-like protein [Thalassophryne amazonica]